MTALLTVSFFVIMFASISRALERSWLTPPMIFVAFGFAVG